MALLYLMKYRNYTVHSLKVFLGQSATLEVSTLLAQVHQVSAHSIHAIIVADSIVTHIIIHGSIGWARQTVTAQAAMTQVLDITAVSWLRLISGR
jgi:hypothetical protein